MDPALRGMFRLTERQPSPLLEIHLAIGDFRTALLAWPMASDGMTNF